MRAAMLTAGPVETVAKYPVEPHITGAYPVTRALAADAERVYWGNTIDGVLYARSPQGSCVETLPVDAGGCPVLVPYDGTHVPEGLALDPQNVYFTAYATQLDPGWKGSAPHIIAKVPKGGGMVTVLATNQPSAQAIATDGENVYWGSYGDSVLRAAPVDAAAPCSQADCRTIAADQPMPAAIAVDKLAIYWTTQAGPDGGPGGVWKAAK
jgi:hypothetical protein